MFWKSLCRLSRGSSSEVNLSGRESFNEGDIMDSTVRTNKVEYKCNLKPYCIVQGPAA